MAYGFESMHPDLARFQELKNRKTREGRTVEESFEPVLIHHPGEQWEYSPGIDWAGKMVERVNGDMKLGEYMQRHIFDPLGIRDMTFSISARQDMQCRLVQCWERSETGGMKKAHYSMRPQPVEEHFGGGGLYASAIDLLKVYRAILQKDCRILGEEMVDLMFTPQLQHTIGLDNLANCPPSYTNSILNSVPSTIPINFGLGGLLNLQSVVGRRGSHSLTWSGVANCYWWIDPQNGIAGVYLSQLLPPGEPEAVELLSKFEETVYSFIAGK
ncbi:uncharacterized protein Rv1367c/MT1414 [Aspergillus udagawae]|uniref:Uncharacterized protein Rv1367c/MT1414 n=1 Tax=Aspergillus udagawae TaxID=91492 RepID=A0A8H3RML3_9EURO|nr:uncharacterized protein Rv1367c/MT1414 [Aspergillus udagawae]